jgi:O-antigen/teichoic acid export membrane protein
MLFLPDDMSWRLNLRYAKVLLKFGGVNSLGVTLTTSHSALPDMIIGQQGAAREVGIFSRGFGFSNFVNGTVTEGIMPIALTFFAKARNDGADIGSLYGKSISMVVVLLWPILFVSSASATLVIEVMFGSQWGESAFFASVVAFWFCLKSANVFFFQVLNATGKEILILIREIPVFIFMILGIWYFYRFGLGQVAIFFVVAGCVDFVVSLFILKFSIKLNFGKYLASLFSPLLISVICYIISLFVVSGLNAASVWLYVQFSVLAFFMPIVWVALVYLFRHPMSNEISRLAHEAFSFISRFFK